MMIFNIKMRVERTVRESGCARSRLQLSVRLARRRQNGPHVQQDDLVFRERKIGLPQRRHEGVIPGDEVRKRLREHASSGDSYPR